MASKPEVTTSTTSCRQLFTSSASVVPTARWSSAIKTRMLDDRRKRYARRMNFIGFEAGIVAGDAHSEGAHEEKLDGLVARDGDSISRPRESERDPGRGCVFVERGRNVLSRGPKRRDVARAKCRRTAQNISGPERL